MTCLFKRLLVFCSSAQRNLYFAKYCSSYFLYSNALISNNSVCVLHYTQYTNCMILHHTCLPVALYCLVCICLSKVARRIKGGAVYNVLSNH